MTRQDIEAFLQPETFTPFVLTMVDGFAIPVNDVRKTLLGLSMLVVAGPDGRLYHIPFRSIAHVSEAGKELG